MEKGLVGKQEQESGINPQTLHFSMLPCKLGRDGSLLVTLENKKPGLTNKGLGSTELEPSLQWV